MERLVILLLALVIDLTIGDPPTAIHPVGWMGRVIAFLTKGGKEFSPRVQFLYGMGMVFLVIALFTALAFYLLAFLRELNTVAYVLVAAVLLKSCFSLRGLRRATLKIRDLLSADKLGEARFELRALVGRDTSRLDTGRMVSATVESAAENTCDSFVAPLFYFLIFGLPGAVAYRVINTLDAMVGHHGEFEYLGKFAAKLDTIANFIPARLTALDIVLATWLHRRQTASAWHTMLRDRKNTESPNAGWTMAAMAGALGVQLEKVGFYRLGSGHNELVPATISISVSLVTTASFIWYFVVLASVGVISYVAA